jgi:hypothetical protein
MWDPAPPQGWGRLEGWGQLQHALYTFWRIHVEGRGKNGLCK